MFNSTHSCVSHLWQSGCEMMLTMVSTAVSNSSDSFSRAKQLSSNPSLSFKAMSSVSQEDTHLSTRSLTGQAASGRCSICWSREQTELQSTDRALLSCERRDAGIRLLWSSSGRTERSSRSTRYRAWPSASVTLSSVWKAHRRSGTAVGHVSGKMWRTKEARATQSLVSTILGPDANWPTWVMSCERSESNWPGGRSDQWREILACNVLAPKNWISGT